MGRIDTAADRKNKVLSVKGLWWEDGIRHTKKMDKELERTLRTFAKFNDCNDIEMCIEG